MPGPLMRGQHFNEQRSGDTGKVVALRLTGGIAMTVADFTVGWPGLLLQVVGGCALLMVKG